MNSTTELKTIKLVLNEDQLCTLITMAHNGIEETKDGHLRADKIEVMSILRDALEYLV